METKCIGLFLASSSQLELERVYIGDLLNDINAALDGEGLRLRLLKWENFDAAFSAVRKQTEYNCKIKDSDIFVALFDTVAGKYTIEEISAAMQLRQNTGKPDLYCFFKTAEAERKGGFAAEFKSKFEEFSGFGIAQFDGMFKKGSFDSIDNLRLEVMKILIPYMTACGANCRLQGDRAVINNIILK